MRRRDLLRTCAAAPLALAAARQARAQIRYEPSWASLDQRPSPAWYTGAKFGIFIHWGVYSVPSVVLPGGPGNLTASLQSGNIVLSWAGASNIQLQMTASLSPANWQIVSGTSGTSSYQISASGGGNAFYRLVQQ